MSSAVRNKDELFVKAPVWRAIATLAIPTILSQIITMIYNLADTFFVGHTGDPFQVAALTLVFPVYMLLTGIGNLFGIGANSKISRSLGAGDREGAKRACVFALWGGLAVTLLILLLLGCFVNPILRTMGASDETLAPARGYILWVMLAGGLPTEASLLLAHMLRGEGEAKRASTGMMLGGILNMILDPVFIYLFDMGVAGAGAATMLSNCVCLGYYVLVIVRAKDRLVITVKPRLFSMRGAGEILLVGLPAAMVIALGSSGNIILTRLLSAYGDLAVAGFGVTQKFGTITMNLSIGLTQGIMPLIGFNYAAGNHNRVKEICRCSFVILAVLIGLFLVLYQLIPGVLMRLFVSDDATVALGQGFLRRWSLCVPGMTFVFLFNSIFQAMGLWKRSLALSVIRQGVLFIPGLFVMNALFSMYGLIWTQPVCDVLSLLLGCGLYLDFIRRMRLEA